MRNKFLIALPLAAALLLSCSCATNHPAPDDGKQDGGDTPAPAATEYIGKLSSPDYAAITAENEAKYAVYYFDGEAGNDANNGASAENAKQSLAEANAIAKSVTQNKPVKLLFKAGTTFYGTLTLENFEAAEETPLLVGVYGADETAEEK